MGHADLTAHGFRSSFKDWASEATKYPDIVAEQALAHQVGGAVEPTGAATCSTSGAG
jgi:hypothetical protein